MQVLGHRQRRADVGVAKQQQRRHRDVGQLHLYLSEDQREVAAVQVHPDADSMDLWMKEVVAEHGVTAYEYLEQGSERSLAYGPLNAPTLEGIRQFGVALTHNPEHLAGFTRLSGSPSPAVTRADGSGRSAGHGG